MQTTTSHLEEIIDDRITLNIMVPRVALRKVTVSRDTPISSLRAYFPNSDIDFLCKGEPLSPDRPLGFYQLRDQDTIVGIPTNAETSTANHWMALTRDSDAFAESVRMNMTRELNPEIRRLYDLRNTRIELHPRKFLRRCHNFAPIRGPERPSAPLVVTEKTETASTEPLPVWW
jgi:hypothetical protein